MIDKIQEYSKICSVEAISKKGYVSDCRSDEKNATEDKNDIGNSVQHFMIVYSTRRTICA